MGKWLSPLVLVLGVVCTGEGTVAQIVPDETLGNERSRLTPDADVGGLPADLIEGGAERGANLFHSFEQFNVNEGQRVYFANPVGIENILSRVTGGDVSDILGTLGVDGAASLFLLNPNGIVFGENALLDVGGSFIASTADSLVFENGFEFGATNPEAPPLLTINVPVGLQYGANPGRINNQSGRLRVQPERTLALVGGDVDLEGGVLFAPNGRVELGSVAGNSLVNLLPTDAGFALDYEGVEGFQDIRLSQAAAVGSSGGDNSSIQVQGQNILLTEGSAIAAFTVGPEAGGDLNVNASESVELIGGGGLFAQTSGSGEGGNLSLSARQLLVQDGAVVSASTFSEGNGGSLSVEVEELVQLVGTDANGFPSAIAAQTQGSGEGGNLSLSARQLLVQDGAVVSASTFSEGNGGTLILDVSEFILLDRGAGISVLSVASGNGGDLILTTDQLTVQNGSFISVSSTASRAGNLTLTANTLTLNNGEISAETGITGAEAGANIILQDIDLLLLENESLISATALEDANGGNVTIDADFIVAKSPEGPEGSDITANAVRGNGGRVSVTSKGGLFGIEFRPQRTPLNDITVSSEFGLAGDFIDNTPGIDPSQGLATLPSNLVDPESLIDRSCTPGSAALQSSFIITGRGGIPISPTDPLSSNDIVSEWVTLDTEAETTEDTETPTHPTSSTPEQIVEAQGWIVNERGQVVLVANAPTVSPQTPRQTTPSCEDIRASAHE